MSSKNLYIGIDFDGTCVTHEYPEIGRPLEGCIQTLHLLQNAGHKLILYTMRSGERLQQAVDYLEGEGVKLYAVNENPSQKYWTQSPKIFCNLYIDDAALGAPLEYKMSDRTGEQIGRPFIDWDQVRSELEERGVL